MYTGNSILYDTLSVVAALVAIFVSWFLFKLYKLKRFYGTLKKLGIAGPEPSIAKCGNLLDFTEYHMKRDIFGEWVQKYGLAGFYMNGQIYIATNDLEIIQTVFLDKPRIFCEREDQIINHAFSESVAFLTDERWRINRSIFSKLFAVYGSSSPETTRVLESTAQIFIDYIDKHAQVSDGKRVTKIKDTIPLIESFVYTGLGKMGVPELLTEVEIGKEFRGDGNLENHSIGYSFAEVVYKYPFMKPFIDGLNYLMRKVLRRLGETEKRVYDICDSTAEYVRMRLKLGKNYTGGKTEKEKQLDRSYENSNSKSFFSAMIITFVKEYVAGNIRYNELVGDLLFATPAKPEPSSRYFNSLVWALGRYQNAQEKIREDVKKHGHKAPYILQFINEVQRLYSTNAAAVQRKSNQDYTIKGITYPKGTIFVYQPNMLAKHPKLWTDPENFNPDRFSPGSYVHPCALKPFGFGARLCPATKFILNEAKVFIAMLVSKYKIVTITPQELLQELWYLNLNTPVDEITVEFHEI